MAGDPTSMSACICKVKHGMPSGGDGDTRPFNVTAVVQMAFSLASAVPACQIVHCTTVVLYMFTIHAPSSACQAAKSVARLCDDYLSLILNRADHCHSCRMTHSGCTPLMHSQQVAHVSHVLVTKLPMLLHTNLAVANNLLTAPQLHETDAAGAPAAA
jgi:hypothetical protein